uniref:Pp2c-1 n=1 Tax=Arundo donax TaxID=35708 RepID=A0A0A9DRG1_ARUDO
MGAQPMPSDSSSYYKNLVPGYSPSCALNSLFFSRLTWFVIGG